MRRRVGALLLAVGAALPAATAAAAEDGGLGADFDRDDYWEVAAPAPGTRAPSVAPDLVQFPTAVEAQFVAAGEEHAADPLGLVVYALDSRRYTIGTDRIGVYVCTWPGAPGSVTMDDAADLVTAQIAPYFDQLSEGAYTLSITKRLTLSIDPALGGSESLLTRARACEAAMLANAVAGDEAALGVLDNTRSGGLATSGISCAPMCGLSNAPATFPANQRWGVVDGGALSYTDQVPPSDQPHLTTAVHEVGHVIGWPHSFSTLVAGDEYDNPIDVMSGNLNAAFTARVDTPYGTTAWNRYAAGWVDPADVVVFEGGVTTVTLAPAGVPGVQMIVLPTTSEYSFLILDARRSLGADAIPAAFQGVSAHYVQQMCLDPNSGTFFVCWGTAAGVFSYPPSRNAIDHVTPTGGTVILDNEAGADLIAAGAKLSVLSGGDDGYVVRLVGFSDTGASVFLDDIIWLADEGITFGCGGTRFCPGANVTRGQMAAFLVRALGLTDGGTVDFDDDDTSIFEADIEKLATAGITKGCNPPANSHFCPNQPVTRGQMAAFLARAAAHLP